MFKSTCFNKTFILALLACALTVCADEAEIIVENDSYSFSLETIVLPADENLSLFGGTYKIKKSERFYYGLTVYGAVAGKRGGFFTGGVTSGVWGTFLDTWEYDAGIFMGGGGGGAAPQGGGLMIRPHFGIRRKFENIALGLGISHIAFPNGDINSSALTLLLDIDFTRAYVSGRMSGTMNIPLKLEKTSWRYSVLGSGYAVSHDMAMLDSSGYSDDIYLAGFGIDYLLNENLFISTQAYGAFSGDIDGYAKILAGPGYSFLFSDRVSLDISFMAGSAGGGGVNTGGGMVLQVNAGLRFLVGRGYSLFVNKGSIASADGDFRGMTTGIGVSYHLDAYKLSNTGEEGIDVGITPWQYSARIKSYFPRNDLRDKSGQEYEPVISLIGFNIDRFLSSRLYLCAQAYAAFDGDAGGYAEGLMGIGYSLYCSEAFSIDSKILIGAGGGGGVDVSSGLIGEAVVGMEYAFNNMYAFTFNVGYMMSLSRTFETPVIEAGIRYSFGQLVKKED